MSILFPQKPVFHHSHTFARVHRREVASVWHQHRPPLHCLVANASRVSQPSLMCRKFCVHAGIFENVPATQNRLDAEGRGCSFDKHPEKIRLSSNECLANKPKRICSVACGCDWALAAKNHATKQRYAVTGSKPLIDP